MVQNAEDLEVFQNDRESKGRFMLLKNKTKQKKTTAHIDFSFQPVNLSTCPTLCAALTHIFRSLLDDPELVLFVNRVVKTPQMFLGCLKAARVKHSL